MNKYVEMDINDVMSHLDYDINTGDFTWKVTTGRQAKGKKAGALLQHGYIAITLRGKRCLAHRLAWAITFGYWPKAQLDHINHVREDNRIANLREASANQNCKNLSIQKRNTSGMTGVSFNKSNGYFHAYITIDGKRKHIGWFKTLSDACNARKHANWQYGFHDNHGVGASNYAHSRDKKKKSYVAVPVDPRQLTITE